MRVHLVDPAAYTPPYDRALASALVRAGAEVSLITSRFSYGDVPPAPGVDVREFFYRWAPARGRRHARLAQHVPDMLRYRRLARDADVVHFQWLSVQALDTRLLPAKRPRVLTAHDVLPREPKPSQLAGQRALYERMDAVVVHSEHGAGRLRDEVGVDPAKVHVIPHGVLYDLVSEHAAPPFAKTKPVVLFFGLIRPYKGLDVLLEAWRAADLDAELWVIGMPRMDPSFVHGPNVRTALRFVSGAELAGAFRAADLVVLPYREIDQSGVLFTAMAFGKPLLLTRVGGFEEIEGAELVPPGDPEALATALRELLADPARLARMAAVERPEYRWDAIAERTLALYAGLQA
jgi:glycosyltransferase involved in cell wall biosynthesis